VEKLLEKQNQNAQPVTEPKPVEEVTSPFPKEEIEKAFNNPLLKSFKKYLDPLMSYFESVEARLQAADKNFEVIAGTINKLEPLISLSAQVAQRQIQPQAQAVPTSPTSGLDMASLMNIVAQAVGSGGGGGNDLLQALSMESLRADIELSKTLKSAVVSKIAGKAVSEVTGSVLGA
jgi:alanyl-tRNA synthetase